MSNFKILWYIWSSTSVFDSEVRCPSCLLSKFTSQLKLIQSVVRVGILGICVTSSILMVLHSGFWISESQFQSPRDAFPGFWMSGPHVPEFQFQGPGSHGSRILDLTVSRWSQGHRFQGCKVLGSRTWISGSHIPGLRS